MSRKMVFAVLAVALLALLSVTGVCAEEMTDIGWQWKYVLEDGGATITGYVAEPIGDLVIPSELDGYPVTGIGYMAFEMCIGLTGVVIPDGVKSIGIAAFDYCEGLTSVTIPDSVTSIGDEVFSDCSSLTGVAIPDRVTSIGSWAFSGCTSLSSVTIPDSVTSIGSMAFAMCGGLASVTVPASVTNIGECAFDAPNSVYPADEIDDGEVVHGSDKLILRVEEGSAAEQYAKENSIPYALTPAETAETADELLIKQIDEYFTMTREEIIEKLGPDFEVVTAGPEGVCDGYLYEDLGMAFAFYPDSDALDSIDCYPDFEIHGIGIGSSFLEIMEALGETEIIETWVELPIYTAFMVRYRLGNSDYTFIAFEEDAPVHSLWIHQAPHIDSRETADKNIFHKIGI